MIPTEVRRGHVTFPRPSENKQPRPLSSAALPYCLSRQKAKAPSSPGSLQFRDLHRAGGKKPGLGGSRAAVKREHSEARLCLFHIRLHQALAAGSTSLSPLSALTDEGNKGTTSMVVVKNN